MGTATRRHEKPLHGGRFPPPRAGGWNEVPGDPVHLQRGGQRIWIGPAAKVARTMLGDREHDDDGTGGRGWPPRAPRPRIGGTSPTRCRETV